MNKRIVPSLLALATAIAAVQPVLAQPRGGWDQGNQRTQFRAERPPQVSDVMPADRQVLPEGPVEISARLSDQGSGVDPRSVRLRLNGRDVTDDARVNAREVRLRTDLRP